jgi:hypothetical protein
MRYLTSFGKRKYKYFRFYKKLTKRTQTKKIDLMHKKYFSGSSLYLEGESEFTIERFKVSYNAF